MKSFTVRLCAGIALAILGCFALIKALDASGRVIMSSDMQHSILYWMPANGVIVKKVMPGYAPLPGTVETSLDNLKGTEFRSAKIFLTVTDSGIHYTALSRGVRYHAFWQPFMPGEQAFARIVDVSIEPDNILADYSVPKGARAAGAFRMTSLMLVAVVSWLFAAFLVARAANKGPASAGSPKPPTLIAA
jgi:hypothetical protein